MLNQLNDLMRKIDRMDNWASAAGHAAIVAGWMTLGLALAFLSSLADDSLAVGIIVFFAGMSIGGYTLREADDARQAIGEPDEGEKLGHGFEDWVAPVVTAIALGVVYAGMF